MYKMAKKQTEQNNYFESCKIYRFNKTKEKTLEFCSCHLSVLIGIKYPSKIFVQSEKGKLENCFVIFPVRFEVIFFCDGKTWHGKKYPFLITKLLCHLWFVWIPSDNVYLLDLVKS